jgi:acetyl-CoA carboxylase biotin carboxyl carrier protein
MASKKKPVVDPQLAKLEQLAELMERHALAELELESKDLKIRLRRGGELATHSSHHPAPVAAPSPVPAVDESTLVSVSSPFVGTFYRAPKPGAPAFVEVGQTVRRGQTLCIVEAMKLMNELESEVDGTVVEILARDAQPVEYGQVLFRVRP